MSGATPDVFQHSSSCMSSCERVVLNAADGLEPEGAGLKSLTDGNRIGEPEKLHLPDWFTSLWPVNILERIVVGEGGVPRRGCVW